MVSISECFERNLKSMLTLDLFHSISFSIFLSSSENSAHLHRGADSEHLISVSYNGGSYATTCSWPLPSVSYSWMSLVTRQKFSIKITPKKAIKGEKKCTSKHSLHSFLYRYGPHASPSILQCPPGISLC